ncbi:MAG: SepM family pheromone-processing serine protease [Sporolactobacillus sp.]
MQKKKYIWRWLLPLVVAVFIAGYFIRLPYFIQMPGAAQNMAKMIEVPGGQPIHGKYSLVYIYLGQANLYSYLWTMLEHNRYTTLVKDDEVMLPGQSEQDYNRIQNNYMRDAQQTAAYVAYRAAGKHPILDRDGVLILAVMPSMPGARVLKSGDIIIDADGRHVSSMDELDALLQPKRVGDRVTLTILRGTERKQIRLAISKFPKSAAIAQKKQGIGIYQANYLNVKVSPKVRFKVGNIGGPSAGLMMTLSIYDQLMRDDLAAGRSIAGTGTIDLNGNVGPIGGIEDKIVGADRSGVRLFFAPVADHEYQQAKRTARAIGSSMIIVPVRTFQDAVSYLERHR